jgi:type I restriction enzyme S subunit
MRDSIAKLPDGWECVKIKDICDVERGGSPRPINQFLTNDPNGKNWIKIGDTKLNSKYVNSTKERIINEGIKHSREVKRGDFLLSNSMSFGRPYILNIDGCIHDGWLVFTNFSEKINKDYLYYVLSSPIIKEQFISQARGAIVKNLNIDIVMNVIIPLPELIVQKRIVEIIETKLNAVEKVKKVSDEQIKIIELLEASYFQEIYNNYSKHWIKMKWEELFDTRTGKLNSNAMVEDGEYPFFTCSKEIYKINTYAFDCEALLLAGNNAAGIYDVKYYNGKFNAYQRTYILTLKNNQNSYQLFKYFLEQKLKIMKKLSKGTNTQFLTMEILKTFDFLVPPVNEQKIIINELKSKSKIINNMKFYLNEQSLYINALSSSILRKAFNGDY